MSEPFREEITRLEALSGGDPGGRVFTHLAEAYRRAGDLDRARDVLDRGMRYHADYASAHVVLARVLLDMGETDEARSAFRRVVELDRHNVVALRSLGDLAVEGRDPEDALRHYRELLTLDPADERLRETVSRLESETPEPDAQAEWADAAAAGGVEVGAGAAPTEAEAGFLAGADDVGGPEPGAEPAGTMAEPDAAQGLHGEAAEVYRSLPHPRPGDERLEERLRTMDSQIESAEGDPTSTPAAPPAEPDVSGEEAEPPGWLEDVESAWTGGSGVAGGGPTPYAWTEAAHAAGEAEDGGEQPISAYFESLLAWRPGGRGSAEPEEGAGQSDGGAAEGDEDLEMFRSWLQSLKK